MEQELIEKLAYLEHDRWSRWEKYRLKRLNDLGGVIGDGEEYHNQLSNWERKSNLSYDKLTEKEKESDKVEARKTIAIFRKVLEEVLKENPYPKSAFPEPTDEQLKKAVSLISQSPISYDRLHGSWGRKVWQFAIEKVLDRLKED